MILSIDKKIASYEYQLIFVAENLKLNSSLFNLIICLLHLEKNKFDEWKW